MFDNNLKYFGLKAFLTKNLEFMHFCVMAGFNLYKMEPWIKEYLQNPDFIDYADYYVKRATNSLQNESNEPLDSELLKKTDEEINDMIYLDEYFFERFHSSRRTRKDAKTSSELAKNIYAYIKHTYTNPLSLKALSRIQVRNKMLRNDFKLKFKIDKGLHIPRRLKDYLLFKEFDI